MIVSEVKHLRHKAKLQHVSFKITSKNEIKTVWFCLPNMNECREELEAEAI